MSYTITTANGLYAGMAIRITGTVPLPPSWSNRWYWQDGDIAIFRFLYKIFGWNWLRTIDGEYSIQSIENNTTVVVI